MIRGSCLCPQTFAFAVRESEYFKFIIRVSHEVSADGDFNVMFDIFFL